MEHARAPVLGQLLAHMECRWLIRIYRSFLQLINSPECFLDLSVLIPALAPVPLRVPVLPPYLALPEVMRPLPDMRPWRLQREHGGLDAGEGLLVPGHLRVDLSATAQVTVIVHK